MNTSPATLIIPSMYEVLIFGAHAAKISARKVYLCGPLLETIASRSYRAGDKVSEMTFSELCAFVRAEGRT